MEMAIMPIKFVLSVVCVTQTVPQPQIQLSEVQQQHLVSCHLRLTLIFDSVLNNNLADTSTYGGCYCYSDSVQTCATKGTCEIDSSASSCGYDTHSYAPEVHWDMCAMSSEQPCRDTDPSWTDSDGLSCRDYGDQYCRTRANKLSTDQVGKTGGDTFASYVNSHYGTDAATACCMCGGGSE